VILGFQSSKFQISEEFFMIRRNLVLASAVAAVFGYSSSANAVVDLNATEPGTVKVSSDIGSNVDVTDAGSQLDVKVKIGRPVATNGGEVYVRFQLSQGATFTGVGAALVVANGSPALDALDQITTVVSSGGRGQDYVVYNIKNAAPLTALAVDATLTLDVTGVKVPSPTEVVRMSYSTFGTSSSAYAGTSPTHTAAADYISFTPGFSFSVAQNSLTADVEHDFKKFTANDASYGSLASITFSADVTAKLPNALGGTPSISSYIGAKEKAIRIEGDFSFLADANGSYDPSNVFLARSEVSSACGNDYAELLKNDSADRAMTTDSVTATEALINVPEIDGSEAVYQLCIAANEGSDIQFKASEYVINFMPATPDPARIADRLGQPAGKIVRDGTVLDAPFFTLAPGYISRIMLSNFGARDANFTIHLQSDEGNVPTINTDSKFYNADTGGLGGTIKARTMLQINATDLVTSFSTKTRGSAKFTIVAPPQNIEGIYQAVNQGTGEVSNLHLIHEGGAAEVK
jgi:hypothetical protein